MCENTIMLDRLEINQQVIDYCNREHPTALKTAQSIATQVTHNHHFLNTWKSFEHKRLNTCCKMQSCYYKWGNNYHWWRPQNLTLKSRASTNSFSCTHNLTAIQRKSLLWVERPHHSLLEGLLEHTKKSPNSGSTMFTLTTPLRFTFIPNKTRPGGRFCK